MKWFQDEKVKGIKVGDYEYLLSMPIGTLTFEKVQQLRNERDKMEDEVEELKKATPKQLWEKDIDEFLVKLDVSFTRIRHEYPDRPYLVTIRTRNGGPPMSCEENNFVMLVSLRPRKHKRRLTQHMRPSTPPRKEIRPSNDLPPKSKPLLKLRRPNLWMRILLRQTELQPQLLLWQASLPPLVSNY
jgi:hypothetical protein